MNDNPAHTPKRDKFKQLLKTLFQYQQDRISLDFGIYRVFRHKAAELERFLETDLPRQVDAAAERHGATPEDAYNDILNFFSRHYQDGDFYPVPRFGGAGAHVLRHNGEETLFTWANRDQYYIKSLAGFGEYRARDVLPADLLGGAGNALIFRVGAVEDARGDQKKPRYFALDPEKTAPDANGVVVTFDYQSDKAREISAEALFQHLAERGQDIPLETLAFHLNRFQTLRKVDFFIHRRLGAFLGEQLEHFVKQEIVRLEEPYTLKRALAARESGAVVADLLAKLEDLQKKLWESKKLAYDAGFIISLDRIAKLAGSAWLQAHLPEIIEKQRGEWAGLGLGKYAKPEDVLYPSPSAPLMKPLPFGTPEGEERKYRPLPVDTRLWNDGGRFKWSLLAAISGNGHNLDAEIDGVAVHSDNWQALNTLNARFRDGIKCIYIDPPYNTGTDGFPYKDGYPHSSWLSMMEDRLRAARPLLRENGAIFVSIDANEQRHLQIALDNTFGAHNRVEEIIWAQNTTKNQSPTYSTNHEYIEVYARSLDAAKKDERMFREPKPGYAEMMELVERLNPDTPAVVEIEREIKALFERHKAELTEQGEEYEKNLDPWKGTYPYCNVEYRTADGRLVMELEARQAKATIWLWQSADSSFPEGGGTANKPGVRDPNDPDYRFYCPPHPVTGRACKHPKRGWVWPRNPVPGLASSFSEMSAQGRIAWGKDETTVPRAKKYLHEVDTQVSKSVVLDYTDGEKELTDLTGQTRSFPNPKPTTLIARFILQTTEARDWVCDFTFGSGTTAQAVAEAHAADRGRRRFLAVELGEHFEKTALPRVKKVFAARRWKNGKPLAVDGIGLFCQVFKLTQYEDTLENCTLQPEASLDVAARMQALAPFARFPELYRDQVLSVLPHFVEQDSPALLFGFENDWLTRPFDFTLRIQRDGRWVERLIDLPESASLLLGQPLERVVEADYRGRRRLIVAGGGMVFYWREFEPGELDEAYVRGDMALLAQHIDWAAQTVFINGIAQNHPTGWLPGPAFETLYALRAKMLEGVPS